MFHAVVYFLSALGLLLYFAHFLIYYFSNFPVHLLTLLIQWTYIQATKYTLIITDMEKFIKDKS